MSTLKSALLNLPLAATVLLKSDIFPGTGGEGVLAQMLLNACLSLFPYWDFIATYAEKVQRMQGVWGVQEGATSDLVTIDVFVLTHKGGNRFINPY